MNIGVHTSHCCKWHGCKYNDNSCPVENGSYSQEYPCEVCRFEWGEYKTRETKKENPRFDEFIKYCQESNLT